MITVIIDNSKGTTKHIVKSDKRMLYVMQSSDGFMVIDPYMLRAVSQHDTLDDAVNVARDFVSC